MFRGTQLDAEEPGMQDSMDCLALKPMSLKPSAILVFAQVTHSPRNGSLPSKPETQLYRVKHIHLEVEESKELSRSPGAIHKTGY